MTGRRMRGNMPHVPSLPAQSALLMIFTAYFLPSLSMLAKQEDDLHGVSSRTVMRAVCVCVCRGGREDGGLRVPAGGELDDGKVARAELLANLVAPLDVGLGRKKEVKKISFQNTGWKRWDDGPSARSRAGVPKKSDVFKCVHMGTAGDPRGKVQPSQLDKKGSNWLVCAWDNMYRGLGRQEAHLGMLRGICALDRAGNLRHDAFL